MDFVSGLPRIQKGHDVVWVIVDRLSKSAHFFPFNMKYFLEKLIKLYMDEIVRLHGISDDVGERKALNPAAIPLVEEAYDKVNLIRQKLQTAQSRQKSYADYRIKDLEFEIGDKKYHPDPTHILQLEDAEVDESLTYKERPVQLLNRKVKELRNKRIPLVKVL
ncbi:uncharacterized protein [Coffea arabica]|uniref:Retrotransposon protein, putative, Ty3-gypsy subclass n=1 Tax=Coffea arabica TaxID=13443 RepID=A0ABM4W8L7_COFAR